MNYTQKMTYILPVIERLPVNYRHMAVQLQCYNPMRKNNQLEAVQLVCHYMADRLRYYTLMKKCNLPAGSVSFLRFPNMAVLVMKHNSWTVLAVEFPHQAVDSKVKLSVVQLHRLAEDY